jgi:transcriptional regulator with XRE-family HTH domain
MSRRESEQGFGERLRRVRAILGYKTAAAFARKLGVKYATYRKWEIHDAAPAIGTLKRAVKHLGAPDWERLLLWLADGEDTPPAWLENGRLKP